MDQELYAVVMVYTCTVCRSARSTTWWRRWASTLVSPSRRCRGYAQTSTWKWRRSATAPTPTPAVSMSTSIHHARPGSHRVVSQAVVIATELRRRPPRGARLRCRRLGGRWLLDRILALVEGSRAGGVQLVISDIHSGLKQAVGAVMYGASWQSCRVHFLRKELAQVGTVTKSL